MSRYTVNYEEVSTDEAKEVKALKDVKFYLTTRLFNKKTKEFKAFVDNGTLTTWSMFTFAMGMMGVDGYWPCKAFANHCGIMQSFTDIPDNY